MRIPIIGRRGTVGLICVLAMAAAAAAQGSGRPAKAATLVPTYAANSRLTYAIEIHTQIGAQATMDTTATAEMRILPGATAGRFDAELHFLAYHTTAHSDTQTSLQQLEKEAGASDQAATSMTPITVRAAGDKITVLSRPNGKNYDQAVEMLVQLARTDSLPNGPVRVGDSWSRVRMQPIPTLAMSVPLTLDASLTALNPESPSTGNQPTATLTLHSHGQANLPPNALPNAAELAAQGLVPEASVSFDTTAVSQYRLPDTVLLSTRSDSHNRMRIRFVGPSPDAQTTNTDIHSTATLKLVKEVTGK